MNVPVTYWLPLTAARFEIQHTLTQYIEGHIGAVQTNLQPNYNGTVYASYGLNPVASYDAINSQSVVPGAMLGNFPWLCHNLYMHARYTANDTMMTALVFPALRGAVNMYLQFLVDINGTLHLPPTSSPEYPYPHGPTNDTNFDLTLLAWGAKTLLALNAEYSFNDPLAGQWADTLARLTAFPTNEHGYMISDGVGFDLPHRCFSHLFAIYPLHLIT